MTSKYQAGLFDLDGVIVDTAKYHYLAWRNLAHKLGFEFTEQDNQRLKGVSRMRSLEILLEVGGLTLDRNERQRLRNKKMKNMCPTSSSWIVRSCYPAPKPACSN